jgi:hypothetical protein
MRVSLVRVVAVIIFAAIAIDALVSIELADIASRQLIADQYPQQPTGHAGGKEDWATQVTIALDWLEVHKEWINVISTIFIAAFTGTLWAATRRLAHFAETQAGDMQSLLRAARDNTSAAASQAQSMRQLHAVSEAQERVMREQAETMAATLDLTKRSTEIAETSANASLRSATVAERSLILADRPWIGISIKIIGSLVITDFSYEVEIAVVLSNYGRSPAIKTACTVLACPSVDIAASAHTEMIELARRSHAMMATPGRTLFPNSPRREDTFKLSIRRDHINVEDEDAGFFIVCCAYYGLPTGGRFRYITVMHEIVRKDRKSIICDTRAPFYRADQLELTTFGGETT